MAPVTQPDLLAVPQPPRAVRIPFGHASFVRDGTLKADSRTCDSPARAREIFHGLVPADDEREHLVAVYLDARSMIKGCSVISIGTLTASLVHPREVFRPAVALAASGIVIMHNHPSGDTQASPEDRETTRRLSQAGRILGIPLLDHVIVAGEAGLFSFREHGLLS
jgi:DNA repair protein RadC